MAEFSESRHQAEFNQSRVLEDCLAVTFALLCNCPQFSSHHHSKSHFWHRYMKPKWLSFNPTYDASSRFQNHCQLSSIWSMSDVLSCGYMALLAKVTLPQRAPKPMHGHQGIGPPNSASHGPHACLHDPQCLSMECWTGPWSSQSQEWALLDCHKVQWLCQHVMFLFHAAPKPGWMHLTVRLDNLTMRRDIIHTKWSKPLSDGPKSYQSTGAWWSTRGYSQEQKPAPSSHHGSTRHWHLLLLVIFKVRSTTTCWSRLTILVLVQHGLVSVYDLYFRAQTQLQLSGNPLAHITTSCLAASSLKVQTLGEPMKWLVSILAWSFVGFCHQKAGWSRAPWRIYWCFKVGYLGW